VKYIFENYIYGNCDRDGDGDGVHNLFTPILDLNLDDADIEKYLSWYKLKKIVVY